MSLLKSIMKKCKDKAIIEKCLKDISSNAPYKYRARHDFRRLTKVTHKEKILNKQWK